MYLVDTNVVSELRKVEAERANPRVSAWAQQVAIDSLYLSVITILELEIGALSMERRDPVQGRLLRKWMRSYVLTVFDDRIMQADLAVALQCAALHVPDRRPDHDAWIAATALVHGMTVVTRNIADFEPMGVDVFNPWQY